MMISVQWAAAWLIAVSLMALVVTMADKRRAKRGGFRIPERTLWFVAILGGSAAMYLTMRGIRHKTLHRRFMWGLPLLMVAQIGMFLFFFSQNWIIFE